ncbi:uncharacterized protein LOC113213519 [Frankliniella occidentalis]|uniref:Uncharacterized protein LOC113213519 n=1 Tax=Frankliniella occidentalis TaxID=133901 RepID=A0A6J1T489_FRAOC|nr:uncharacterized protein LOC113213519 [Frankliniella occidentalis]
MGILVRLCQVWLVAALCCAAVTAVPAHDQGGHHHLQGGHHGRQDGHHGPSHGRQVQAGRCGERRYWNASQQSCMDCTQCPELTMRPCDGFRDAKCAPLSSLVIDWSWLRQQQPAPTPADRKKHGGVHERINSLTEAEALLRDELKHIPSRDKIVDFGDDYILPDHPRQPLPHKKQTRKSKKAHKAKPFGDYDDFADFGASGDAVGDPVSDDEDIAQAVWRKSHRASSTAAPASTAAPTTTTTTTARPTTISLVEDFIVIKEEQEAARPDLDVVATTQTFTTAETLVWDWQAGVLVAAVCACLLFFIVAAAYSCQHAWHFKKLKKNLDADMEEISARLALMSGMGAEHFQDTGATPTVINEKAGGAAFPVRRGDHLRTGRQQNDYSVATGPRKTRV